MTAVVGREKRVIIGVWISCAYVQAVEGSGECNEKWKGSQSRTKARAVVRTSARDITLDFYLRSSFIREETSLYTSPRGHLELLLQYNNIFTTYPYNKANLRCLHQHTLSSFKFRGGQGTSTG
jgi:hypothetical protein